MVNLMINSTVRKDAVRLNLQRLFYVHGWTVFRKEPGMAVRLCPWMEVQIFAPAISALPPSMAVVFRKEPGRRCGYVQGWTKHE
jgi:hypothetical protein